MPSLSVWQGHPLVQERIWARPCSSDAQVRCPCFGGEGGISPCLWLCERTTRAASSAPPAALLRRASLVSPWESHAKGQLTARWPWHRSCPPLLKLCCWVGCSPSPVHLRHSGGRKENPSENHNLITPICSSTASHFCLPGCLSLMLSSTLFSISCNHLLEISSFKMSPWKGNSASWEWAEATTRKPIQKQPSSGGRAVFLLYSLKPYSGFLFRVGLFERPAAGTSLSLVVSANGAVEKLPPHVVGGDLNQPVTANFCIDH